MEDMGKLSYEIKDGRWITELQDEKGKYFSVTGVGKTQVESEENAREQWFNIKRGMIETRILKELNMKNKIVFVNKPSIVGKNKQMLIYLPVVIKRLIDPEKEYKITLEEIESK